METTQPNSFKEFWPFYVCEHNNRKNRLIHFAGTGLTFVFLIAAFVSNNFWLLLGLPLSGYGFAWFGHFFVEHNKPATFKAPFYSLMGDYKMFFMILFGRMEAEVDRCRKIMGKTA